MKVSRFQVTVFSTLLYCLLIWNPAFSYDVVLKSGKIISGTLMNEDETSVQIESRPGITLTFQKKYLDLQAMKLRNRSGSSKKAETAEAQTQHTRKKTTEKQEKNRVFTNEDIQKLREKYHWEEDSTQSQTQTQPETQTQTNTRPTSEMRRPHHEQNQKSEQQWKQSILSMYERQQSAERQYQSLQEECNSLGPEGKTRRDELGTTAPQMYYKTLFDLNKRQEEVCSQAEDARKSAASVQDEYDALRQEARAAGIPEAWYDPERIKEEE